MNHQQHGDQEFSAEGLWRIASSGQLEARISLKLLHHSCVLLHVAAEIAYGFHSGHKAGILQLHKSVLCASPVGPAAGRDINCLDGGQEIPESGLDGIGIASGDPIGPSARYCHIGFPRQTAANLQKRSDSGWAGP